MGYTVAEIIDLLQFSYGLYATDICERTSIKYTNIQIAKRENLLTKKTEQMFTNYFGEDWNSVGTIRKYQQQKNIVMNVDGEKIRKLRRDKELSLNDLSRELGVGRERLRDIETGKATFSNWQEYLKFKQYFKEDLLKEDAPKKKKRFIKKEFITFRNVGGSWEMVKRVKEVKV